MNYKILIIIISIFFLISCEQNNVDKKIFNQQLFDKYTNTGFALIYTDSLKKEKKITKKIDNRSLLIFHKNLKKNSFVKITNPMNQKTIIAEVISNNVDFSDFYNCVITSRIVEELSLDLNEPYVDLVLISHNSTFDNSLGEFWGFFELRICLITANLQFFGRNTLIENSVELSFTSLLEKLPDSLTYS